MSTKEIKVCDHCKLEATKGGCGEGDVLDICIKSSPCHWRADLCSCCRDELYKHIEEYMGNSFV